MKLSPAWMNQHRFCAKIAVLSATFLLQSTAQAVVTGQITATITLGTGCEINDVAFPVPNPLSFGTLDFGDWIELNNPGNPNIDASTQGQAGAGVTVECTSGVTYTIALDNGLYHDGTDRRMRHATIPTEHVLYKVYKDAARTDEWITPKSVTTTASPDIQTHHFYGRVPPQNQDEAGIYNDTLTVTVNW